MEWLLGILIAGAMAALLKILFEAAALPFVIGLAWMWVRIYTLDLPRQVRQQRWARVHDHILIDVKHLQEKWKLAEHLTAPRILWALLRSIRDDVSWRWYVAPDVAYMVGNSLRTWRLDAGLDLEDIIIRTGYSFEAIKAFESTPEWRLSVDVIHTYANLTGRSTTSPEVEDLAKSYLMWLRYIPWLFLSTMLVIAALTTSTLIVRNLNTIYVQSSVAADNTDTPLLIAENPSDGIIISPWRNFVKSWVASDVNSAIWAAGSYYLRRVEGELGPRPSNWTVNLSSSAKVGPDQAVVLTAATNRDVGPTRWGLQIYDANSGAAVKNCSSGSSCSVTVIGTGASRTYRARVGMFGGSETQATSGSVVVTWAQRFTWTASLLASKTNPAANEAVALIATADHDVGPTSWGLQIYDAATGAAILNCSSGTNCTVTVTGTGASRTYQVRVGMFDGSEAQANSGLSIVNSGSTTWITSLAARAMGLIHWSLQSYTYDEAFIQAILSKVSAAQFTPDWVIHKTSMTNLMYQPSNLVVLLKDAIIARRTFIQSSVSQIEATSMARDSAPYILAILLFLTLCRVNNDRLRWYSPAKAIKLSI